MTKGNASLRCHHLHTAQRLVQIAARQAAASPDRMNDADLGDNIDDYTQDVDGQRSKGDAERQSVINADPAVHLDPRLVPTVAKTAILAPS